jgi:endonuclease/exonuclease/phosphatase family metal-dependent hydrolase
MIHNLKIIFLNVMMPVPKPLRFIAQEQRLHQLTQWISTIHSTIDAFIFAELIPIAYEQTLRKTLLALGFIHYTTQRVNLNVVRSGVVIYSRHPILSTNDISYHTPCEGSDCLADKNMLYAQLRIQNRNVTSHEANAHIFMTHLHAWPTPFSQSVRSQQLAQLQQFITLHEIPPTDLIMVIGDFNIDYHHNQEILTTLNATNIPCSSLQKFTMDATKNPLVGLDNIEYYSNENFPHGCVKEYWQQHSCLCCPQEWIDYGIIVNNNTSIANMSQEIIIPQIPSYDVTLGPPLGPLATKWKLENTVSDHFPVQINITWSTTDATQAFKAPKVQMNTEWTWQMSHTWTAALCTLIILIWFIIIYFILPRHFNKVCACQRQDTTEPDKTQFLEA